MDVTWIDAVIDAGVDPRDLSEETQELCKHVFVFAQRAEKDSVDELRGASNLKRQLADVRRAIEQQSSTTRAHLAGRFKVD